jgi:hypothetical protein
VKIGVDLKDAVQRIRRLPADERGGGQAAEFMLVIPVFMTILLMGVQFVLLCNASLLVQYAAYNAARSAIVWIPAGPEVDAKMKRNRLLPQQAQASWEQKNERMHAAAAMSLIGVSPPLDQLGLTGVALQQGMIGDYIASTVLQHLVPSFGASDDGEIDTKYGRLARKWLYARNHVEVRIQEGSDEQQKGGAQEINVSDTGNVTATVGYRFYLHIPIANRLLGEPFVHVPGFFQMGPYYRWISAKVTLVNEGQPLYHGG